MNQNIEQKQNEQWAQAKNLEMPSSMRMLDLSKNYLSSIEKKFGAFLAKLGINPGNYDGKLSWNNTGAEKMYQEKILPLQKKIEKEKGNLKKQDIMMQLTQAVLQARDIDMWSIEKLARQEWKEKEFQKASSELLGNDEYKDLEKKLSEQVSKLDEVYVVEWEKKDNKDKANITKELSEQWIKAMNDYKDGKINKTQYENIIAYTMKSAQEMNVEYGVTEKLWKTLEFWMQSGTLPVAMMVTPGIKRALPMLPSVIGIGIWARAVSLTQSNQTSGEKAWEGTKLVWETALTIAPITGTYMSGKETYDAYQRYKNGNGSMSEVVANGIGTWVSAVFDWVTIFLVATWVGAAPAVWLQAVRWAAKEAVKWGFKKLIWVFAKEWSEKATQNIAEWVAVKSPGLIKTASEFVSGKIHLVWSAYKELWPKEFIKRASRQALEDTTMWLWDIVTLRGIRDSKIMSKLPDSMKLFEKGKKATSGMRANIVENLEKFGMAKRGSAEKIRLRWTAAEFRVANQEANAAMRNDGWASQVEATHAKYKEELSTKHLDASLKELEWMVKHNDGTPEQFEAVLSWIKMQDEYAGHALNVLNKLENKLANHAGNQERLVQEVEKMLENTKWTVSKSLYEYLERVLSKVKAWENFAPGSGNHLVLLNKINGKDAIDIYRGTQWYEDYMKQLWAGEKESQSGYLGQYTGSLETMTKLVFSWKIHSEWERGNIFIKEYMEMLKSAERSGWWTVRIENTEFWKQYNLWQYFENGALKNGYEGTVVHILEKYKGSPIEKAFLENLDLSLIHNPTIKGEIIERGIAVIKHCDGKEAIALLKHLAFYPEFKTLLSAKFSPTHVGNITKAQELNIGKWNGEIWVINNLIYASMKNPNKIEAHNDLLFLMEFAREKNPNKLIKVNITQWDIKNFTLENLEKIKFEKWEYTKEQIDSLIVSVSKLWWDDTKKAMDILIQKLDNGNIHEFAKRLESFESHALFCQHYTKEAPEVIKRVIDDGREYSIEFKIKFIEELGKTGLFPIEWLKQRLWVNLLRVTDANTMAHKLDLIESFFKNSDLNLVEFKELHDKVQELKKSPIYINESFDAGKAFMELVDIGRSFSDREIKDLKNNGKITHKTLNDIQEIIQSGELKNRNGDLIKKYDPVEIEKLKIVEKQVQEALNNYELNLFNPSSFQEKKLDTEKIAYLTNSIEWMIGHKFSFSNGWENPRNLNRTIIKQLNVIKSNFHVEPHIIDGFLYDVLKSTKIEWFHVGEKIKLLQTLERTGIIKPSIEHKQEYILHLWATDSTELRTFAHAIKEYTKDFSKGLQASNEVMQWLKKAGDKDGILQYVKDTIQERVPVEEAYLVGKELKDGIDYVRIDGKIYITEIYPARYFITQLLDGKKDLKQKETFMELIHNKSDFWGKTFKQYYNETSDIETKILMSYHDDIKYDADVIQFLKDHAKSHQKLVMYVIEKRKDYDIILSGNLENWGNVTHEMLSKSLTKTKLEEIEGRKLSQEEFEKIKYGIEKMFQLQKDPEFMRIITGIRWEENITDENGKLKKEYTDLMAKYGDTFQALLLHNGQTVEKVESLLKSFDIRTILMLIGSYTIFNDAMAEKVKKVESEANGNISALKSLVLDDVFRRNIITGIREKNDEELKYKQNYDHTNDGKIKQRKENVRSVRSVEAWQEHKENDNINIKERVERTSEALKISSDIGNTKVDLSNYNLPPEVKQKTLEIFWKEINLKTVLGILITFWIMTPTEAQAAAQDIEQSWKSSPEFKKFNELGWEKSAEAMKIREETVKRLAWEKLKPFIDGFDERIRDRNREKVASYPANIQAILADIYEKWINILQDKSQRWLNQFNWSLITYIDQIYQVSWKWEQAALNISKRFPEFEWTEFQKTIIEIWKNIDSAWKNYDEAEKWKKINQMLKSIK